MKKLIDWWDKSVLRWSILFLVFFIPLYPKFPLLDVTQTWVNIRLEDVFIALLGGIFCLQWFRGKVTVRSPLTISILIYWIVGFVVTLHGLLFIVSSVPNMQAHLILLFYLRHIEYMLLFFAAFTMVRSRKDAMVFAFVYSVVLLLVGAYGFLQKYAGYPAVLTMNEEFAKGILLKLGPENRISSTFGGHYDLAAYLIFSLPIIASLFFAVGNKWFKLGLIGVYLVSYYVLMFTASRVSFAVYIVIIVFTLWLLKKRWFIIPVVVLSILIMREVGVISERFEKTIRKSPIVYDAVTNQPIATLEDFQRMPTSTPIPTPIGAVKQPAVSTEIEPTPTPYEDLPLGSGFLEIPFKTTRLLTASEAGQFATSSGEFLVREGLVYDISFTTRIQGSWPRALTAFKRNVLLGSGYSSIDLASDNNYLRILGESGIAGLISFISIFFVFLLMVRHTLRSVEEKFSRYFIVGVAGGIVGLLLNGILIDVFESSKVAYILWMAIGVATALYLMDSSKSISYLKEAIIVLRHHATTIFIFFIIVIMYFYDTLSIYFTGDDFTWLRWASTEPAGGIVEYITKANGFFYRPFTKLLLYEVYPYFGMRPGAYHLLSLGFHFGSAVLAALIIRKITKRAGAGFIAGLLFLIHPIHAENMLWMSGLSSVSSGFFYLGSLYSLLSYIQTRQLARFIWYSISLVLFILALSAYEMAVTIPLIGMAAVYLFSPREKSDVLLNIRIVALKLWVSVRSMIPFFITLGGYFYLRNVVAGSHWLSGDYNVKISKFLFNATGNLFGYLGELIAGFWTIPYYDLARLTLRTNLFISFLMLCGLLLLLIAFVSRYFKKKRTVDPALLFIILLILLPLLPVLGLGNIAERYLYVSSVGFTGLIGILTRRSISAGFSRIALYFGLCILLAITYSFQLQHEKDMWNEAGAISKNILRAIPTTYKTFPDNTILYFVDVPQRIGRAWVFPVGLDDGLWLIYQNDTIIVEFGSSIEEGLKLKDVNPLVKVLHYSSGKLEEVERQSIPVR